MTAIPNQEFNSLLSLRPLVNVLKKMIAEGNPGAKKLYENILNEIEAKPELLQPLSDTSVLVNNAEIVETVLSTIFPPSTSANQGIYAISFPFRHETIYASPQFKELFLKDDSNIITVPDTNANFTIAKATLNLAYNLLLRKFYSFDVPAIAYSMHSFVDPESGLTKYLRLKLNAQFVEVKLLNKQFTLPTTFHVQHSLEMEELRKVFPIENFQFEGLVVIDVTDVTNEQVITEIKSTLLNINAFSDVTVYDTLQQHIQTYLGLKDVTIGITPFFKINDYHLFSDVHFNNSVLFKNEKAW
ncbi:MAG: hypothetical protein ICV66_07545, partial [Chitinophagaceae bacterium]|nr:hypothetical protein [Chitinophagaceae bacterium]